jgi:hypothetical protein
VRVSTVADPYGYFPARVEDVTPAAAAAPAAAAVTDGASAPPPDPPLGILAAPQRLALPAGDEQPLVLGLRGANPELEAVARLTGVTFVPAEGPKPTRRVSTLLRRFRPGPPTPAPLGAVPDVVYAPPLAAADAPVTADTGLVGKAKKVAKDAAANVQQVWNRRGAASDATPTETAPVPGTAGAYPTTKPDPGSFIAPKADFLAGDDLEAQIAQVRNVAAAAGQLITIEIDPDDRRIGLELSSDPDERIRPSNPSGFGDPI